MRKDAPQRHNQRHLTGALNPTAEIKGLLDSPVSLFKNNINQAKGFVLGFVLSCHSFTLNSFSHRRSAAALTQVSSDEVSTFV